ncbi:MAG: hypothetical protein ACLT4X_00260 [Phascolarctobacterium sp.]
MLAKAIAGEAEVPFFSISGSEFVEMFVGMVLLVSAICLSKLRKRLPASFSSMRLMLLVNAVTVVNLAVMMNVSKH